ncbi:MAG: formate dehydrogenase gamma subunit [Deltaproteobacteria bacterium]|nr:formate dehydrogenase gamma subunit [Deltaproteobacteria bacterium]
MNEQAQATGHIFQIRWIPKYTFVERLLHWVHTASFVPLVATGLVLYLDFLKPLAQGEAGEWMRLVHRLTAILFVGEPVIYGILQPRRLWMHIKEFSFERDDLGWMKSAFGYYVLGRHTDMPPQGRFNTGEKINGMVMILTWALFVGTGLVMWFGKGLVPADIFRLMVMVHDHPLMWAALVSMRFGYTSASYAAEHHAKWYYGPKRAQELYEAKKKAASSKH